MRSIFKLLIAAGMFSTMGAASFAAPPSFDCRKASSDDEKAICGDAGLSANDVKTTQKFNEIKSRDRSRALTIAREFLAARKACRSNASCIRLEQEAALARFEAALDSPIPDAPQFAPVPTRPLASQAKTPPNPWPDAYARREFRLGISLSDFKSTGYPDKNSGDFVYSVCSNEKRAENYKYYMVSLPSDAFKAAGAVLCKFVHDQAITPTYSSVYESRLGMAEYSLSTDFYFIPDDAGVLRLFWIVTRGPSDAFLSLSSSMAIAYGPHQSRTEEWKNKIGNTFTNQILVWKNSSSLIEMRNFSYDINTLRIEHILPNLMSKLNQAFEQKAIESSKKL